MNKTIFTGMLACFMLGMVFSAKAQYAFFPDQGVITYKKTVHVKNLLKRHMSTLEDGDFSLNMFSQLVEKAPETAVFTKKLSFNRQEMLLEPVEEKQPPLVSTIMQFGILDFNAKIYQNIDKNESKMLFQIGGSDVAIQDSL